MKLLTLCACIATTAALAADPATPDGNLLKPTNQVESWRFELHEGGQGEIKALDDAIVLQTTAIDGENWHVQAFQTDLNLKAGQRYLVSFEIKAEQSQSVSLVAGVDQDDYHFIGLEESVFATSEYKAKAYTFTASGVEPQKNRIGFVLGDAKGTVYVKNMVLKAQAP